MYVDSVAKKDAPLIKLNESAVNNDTDEPRAKQTSHVIRNIYKIIVLQFLEGI